MSFTNGVPYGSNRLSDAAGITVTTNAAGDITALLGKTLAYDAAGRLAEASAVPPCPSGQNCSGAVTTLSRFNGWGQRFLRETPTAQTVFSYGSDGHNLLSETTRQVTPSGQTTTLNTTEHIYLPTASGPMPVAAVINGVHYAVHSDHLNTPRRLSASNKAVRWQWPYSGFGEIAPQATPAAGQAPLSYALRYPGQVDDGNGLFYNWNRFYDPRVGRYTSSDPIGLEGGWNRFGYVGGNPLSRIDPTGLKDYLDRCVGRYANCSHTQNPDASTPYNWLQWTYCKKVVDNICEKGPHICCESDKQTCLDGLVPQAVSTPEHIQQTGQCMAEYSACMQRGGAK